MPGMRIALTFISVSLDSRIPHNSPSAPYLFHLAFKSKRKFYEMTLTLELQLSMSLSIHDRYNLNRCNAGVSIFDHSILE